MTPSVERKALRTDYRSIPGPTERRLFVLLARARESENRTSFPTALRPKLPISKGFISLSGIKSPVPYLCFLTGTAGRYFMPYFLVRSRSNVVARAKLATFRRS
jgi:hypothetical protein